MRRHFACAIMIAGLVAATPILAQTAADFGGTGGGSVRIGADADICASAKDGAIRFTSSTDTWEFCNGSAWVPFERAPVLPGYFVQTATRWNGNLGGLSGADAKCLTELQTTYDWKGKSNAGTLTSSRVKAFLCDGATCNNLIGNMPYFYAKANSTTAGGEGFMTDSSGRGPMSQDYWDHFLMDSTYNIWTNRGTVDASTWATTGQGAAHCTNWTSSSSGVNGRSSNAGWDDARRWNEVNDSCNMTLYLICFVNP